ncbi:MAG: excinuclease ABC subunit UvrA, partial [Bryobacteraceae bacterium]
IYAEGQRRYVETLSAYARQFLDQMERPDVDSIDGLSPAISIEQKTTSRSPRSTVGTITEIYDYLRLLYSSIGVPHCPLCGHQISQQSPEQILHQVLSLTPEDRVMILAPIVRGRKGEYKKELEKLARQGFVRARIDGVLRSLDEDIALDRRRNHTIEVVVDRLLVKPGIERRLEASIQTATQLAGGVVTVCVVGGEERMYSLRLACPECGESVPQLEPRSFSFNSKFGACEQCAGLGSKWGFDPDKLIVKPSKPVLEALPFAVDNLLDGALAYAVPSVTTRKRTPWRRLSARDRALLLDGDGRYSGLLKLLMSRYTAADSEEQERYDDYMSYIPCKRCEGQRLRPSSLAVRVKGMSIAEFTALPLMRTLLTVKSWRFTERENQIAGRLLDEIRNRLEFLAEVGLDYLCLDRPASTLSGGEGQRIRLATQIGSRLRGVLYVLDEPSIGLHPRDNQRLLDTLARLRDMGNTVLVVEHDAETIERADYVVDLGPGAGRLGGELVATGAPLDIARNPASLTGQYLAGVRSIAAPAARRSPNAKKIVVKGARLHNLKNIDVEIPLGVFTVVTGVSGSGKSTLINDILYRALARAINGAGAFPGEHDAITGVQHVDKVIRIDQSPIGRTPRSNPATYTGLFTPIRDLFALLPDSRERGYKPGRFSFNVKGGRCEACQGDGLKRIEMNFLPDVYVTCDVCRGRRYNQETLEVKYKGYSIADLLEATVEEAMPVLENIPKIRPKLETLNDVGLGYIHLGQSSTTLSGGEAQRIKLSRELSRRQTGRTLYVLDEPTTGLHFEDVRKLLDVLQRLVSLGNTVVVIEHNLDVIKTADWLIDLGPDGGEYGGRVVACGTPEQVRRSKKSYTAAALGKALNGAAS